MSLNMRIKYDLQIVALGTSKINRTQEFQLPGVNAMKFQLKKIFNESLLAKFVWAIDGEIYLGNGWRARLRILMFL